MNLRRNIIANYVSQTYVVAAGVLTLPLYIKYMGAEAYGLIGFFATLQAGFSILDVALSPATARESARFRGGALDVGTYRRLIRALEWIFVMVALLGGGLLFLASDFISEYWLRVALLPVTEVRRVVQLMAVIVSTRWMCGLYRGIVTGSEKLVWLGWFNSSIATLRFVLVLPAFLWMGTTPMAFFLYQGVVALMELIGLFIYSHRLLPTVEVKELQAWSLSPLRPLLKFSATMLFAASVWFLLTQTDRLVLSRLLDLRHYGGYTLAVLVAGGVTIVSNPVSGAIMPRMARLEAQGDVGELIRVYRQATQLVAVIAGTAAATVVAFAERLLWAWTGDRLLAHESAYILTLYTAGNAILAVSAFPYYLQQAKGDLRMHLVGNALFAIVLVPMVIWAARRHGAVGVGYVWLCTNLAIFAVWLPLVHRRFAPGINLRWYVQDVLVIYSAVAIAGLSVANLFPASEHRWLQLALIVSAGAVILGAGAVASSAFWGTIRRMSARSPERAA